MIEDNFDRIFDHLTERYTAPRALTVWQRGQIASTLAASEARGATGCGAGDTTAPSPDDAIWYNIVDLNQDIRLSDIRDWLARHDHPEATLLSEDNAVALWQKAWSKELKPLSTDLGPDYMLSHVGQPDHDDYRQSIRQIRRWLRDNYDNLWNEYTTDEASAAFESKSGRTLRPL